MALTMTRTRTQTTLTRLAKVLANLNGELAFLDELMATSREAADELAGRRDELLRHRTAVQVTVSQFDGAIDVEQIGLAVEWARPYGGRQSRSLAQRYKETHLYRKSGD